MGWDEIMKIKRCISPKVFAFAECHSSFFLRSLFISRVTFTALVQYIFWSSLKYILAPGVWNWFRSWLFLTRFLSCKVAHVKTTLSWKILPTQSYNFNQTEEEFLDIFFYLISSIRALHIFLLTNFFWTTLLERVKTLQRLQRLHKQVCDFRIRPAKFCFSLTFEIKRHTELLKLLSLSWWPYSEARIRSLV